MIRFAVIDNDTVVNTIIADSAQVVQEVTGLLGVPSDIAQMGDVYDSETGEITPPVIPEPDEPLTEDAAPSDPAE